MASFAEIVKCLSCHMRLFDGERFDYHRHPSKERVALPKHLRSKLAVNHNGEFEKIPG